ncbi:protein RADIALIS-like 3 [Nicotiana tomentosiformis]|uniref:protein RADIALIS-like 3 n=1 Tax=Nicotiana tomentosiformis TaxID=4098 RepID=UPI00388C552A
MSASTSVVWSREEERAFESAIAMQHSIEDSKEQWQKIALIVPNKTIEELKQHYQLLVDDVTATDAGYVPIPNCTFSSTNESIRGYGNELAGTTHYSNAQGGKGGCRTQ